MVGVARLFGKGGTTPLLFPVNPNTLGNGYGPPPRAPFISKVNGAPFWGTGDTAKTLGMTDPKRRCPLLKETPLGEVRRGKL